MSETKVIDPQSNVDDAAVQAAFVTEALSRFNICLTSGKLDQAVMWLQQASSITELTDEQLSNVKQAYADCILECSREIEVSAIKCGNILSTHHDHAKHILESATQLVELNRRGSHELPAAISLMVEGFATQLRDATANFFTPDHSYTTNADLDAVFTLIASIKENTAKLTRNAASFGLSAEKNSELIAVAISNARYSLCLFLPGLLSDWDKSQWYCAQAMRLLKSSHNGNFPFRNRGIGQALIVGTSRALEDALTSLKKHRYFASTKALKSAEALLTL